MTDQEKLELRTALSFLSGRYEADRYISKQQAKLLGLDLKEFAGGVVVYSEREKQIILVRCEEIVFGYIEKALTK